jgi:hypothetical protein
MLDRISRTVHWTLCTGIRSYWQPFRARARARKKCPVDKRKRVRDRRRSMNRIRRSGTAVIGALSSLLSMGMGCGASSPSVATPRPLASSHAPNHAHLARPAVTAPPAPPVPARLPPATRTFQKVDVGMSPILSVTGWGDKVHLLGDDNRIVTYAGGRVVKDEPHVCIPSPNAMEFARFAALHATAQGLIALGTGVVPKSRSFPGVMVAKAAKTGRWSCEWKWWWGPVTMVSAPGLSWVITVGFGGQPELHAVEGPALPMPTIPLTRHVRAASVSPQEAWMLAWSADMMTLARTTAPIGSEHGTAEGWMSMPPPPFEYAVDLWADGAGTLWVIGAKRPTEPEYKWPDVKLEGIELARWGDGGWVKVPTPASFNASLVMGTAKNDVWFFGEGTALQWDGKELREGVLPIAKPRAAWSPREGELWIVGDGGAARMSSDSR